jgi:aldehyde:ferredoxin oxidoreductase
MSFLGQILDLDLTSGRSTCAAFPEKLARKFLTGRGFNVRFLCRHMVPGIEPLGPENVLVFSCGLLTGTSSPASTRLHINSLSPLTGLLGSSNVGGDFGPALRACHIQTLVLRGRAPDPVYLLIDGDRAQVLDARPFWGLDAWETQDWIKDKLSDAKVSTLTIGPAGENMVPFACILSGQDHAAGRTGMGAVMGSKNLKAVVVMNRDVGREPTFQSGRDVKKAYVSKIRMSPQFGTLSVHGGAGYVGWADDTGILATHNYRENHFEGAGLVDGKRLTPYKTRSRGCRGCPVHCKADLRLYGGKTRQIRPEFESIVALGPKCGLSEPETVVQLDNLCSRLGLDTVSAGSAIAFAMDLYDRGMLSMRDTGNMDLSWGNGEAMENLIRQMANKEGLGALLSMGVRQASAVIGNGAGRFAPHVKGLELSAYHPSHIMGTALGYAVSSRGGDFNHFFPAIEYVLSSEKAARVIGSPHAVALLSTRGKAALVKRSMIVSIVVDCLGLCKVPALSLIKEFDLKNEAELVSAVVGWSVDPETLFFMGERIAHLERIFNIRNGASADDDRLPEMFFSSTGSSDAPLSVFDWVKPMVLEFYGLMGWDQAGQPTEETISRFDLRAHMTGPEDWKKAG